MVAFAAVAAIMVTPAAIVLLGDRLDSLDVRRFAVGAGPARAGARPVEQMFFYRWTKFVMRQAIAVGVAVIAVLLVLGAPFLGVKWGLPDDRVLPDSARCARSVTRCARLFCQLRERCDRRDSANGGGDTDRTRPLRRRVVAAYRTYRRCLRRAPRSSMEYWSGLHRPRRDERRQRVLDRQLHGATVLRGVRDPAGPVARHRNSWRPTRCR